MIAYGRNSLTDTSVMREVLLLLDVPVFLAGVGCARYMLTMLQVSDFNRLCACVFGGKCSIADGVPYFDATAR
jgi:hypothetical protein